MKAMLNRLVDRAFDKFVKSLDDVTQSFKVVDGVVPSTFEDVK